MLSVYSSDLSHVQISLYWACLKVAAFLERVDEAAMTNLLGVAVLLQLDISWK